MYPSPRFIIPLCVIFVFLVAFLVFGMVTTRAQNEPPVQAQATGYVIGDPDRFGDTPPAELAGMTYAQRVECSPAMTETTPVPLFCGVHPGGGDMFRAGIQHSMRDKDMSDYLFAQEDEMRVAGQSYWVYIDDGGFFYVMSQQQ